MVSRVNSEINWPVDADWPKTTDRQTKADWSAYAASYDLLLEHNPAYQDLLGEFEAACSTEDAPQVIYDVGGGTGNYTQVAASMFPESSIFFIEPDPGMSSHARKKLSAHQNVTYIERPLQQVEPPALADLVICVHALYSMPKPHDRLSELRGLLRPGGLLFLIDLGRPMNVTDWRSYLFSHLTRELGVVKAIQIVWKGREIAKQNKAILKAQLDNLYWMHSESEIATAVEDAGFEIEKQKTVYRDYSDLLLCRAAR